MEPDDALDGGVAAGALAELSLDVEEGFDSVEGALEAATLPESGPVPDGFSEDEVSDEGAELLEA